MPSVSIPATPVKPCQEYIENKQPDLSCQAKNDFSYKNHKRNETFEIYPHFVNFTPSKHYTSSRNLPISKRAAIYTFSNRARYRLFSTLAKMKTKHSFTPLFLTLTYHYGFSACEKIHRVHLHTFLTRLRKLDPKVQYIWRLEYQKRKAPHFHFILFPGPVYKTYGPGKYEIALSLLWHSVADPRSSAHAKYGFRSEMLTDYRKACAYLGKYLAKTDDTFYSSSIGKQWGCSRNLPIHKKNVIKCSAEIANIVIERVRLWMFKTGRVKYASFVYFDSSRPQGIFIDEYEFYILLLDLKSQSYAVEFS